jgi:cytochrome c-type biogenesis protein CcsB
MNSTMFNISYIFYTASTVLYLAYLFSKREKFSELAHNLLLGAIAIHVVSVLIRIVLAGTAPWGNWFSSFSFFGLIVALVYLVIARSNHIPILGAFVMPISWLLLTAAFWSNKTTHAEPAFNSIWLAVHVPVIFTSYALLGVAFAVGIAYLLQERQMKSKHPTELTYRLPSLEELDALIVRLILAAFPALTLGIILGGLWAHSAWGRFWGWDPKETSAFITWLIYVFYLTMRFGIGWRGRKTAYLSLVGFCLVLFTYVGVNYLSPLHGFLPRGQ